MRSGKNKQVLSPEGKCEFMTVEKGAEMIIREDKGQLKEERCM